MVTGGTLKAQKFNVVLALDREIAGRIDTLSQILARLEMRYVFPGQRDGFARFRVSTDPRRPEMQRKTAKSTNFNAFTPGEGVTHKIKKVLNRQLDVFCRQMLLLSGDHFYEF